MVYLLNLDLTDWDNTVSMIYHFENYADVEDFILSEEILEQSDIDDLMNDGHLIFDKRCAFYVGELKVNDRML